MANPMIATGTIASEEVFEGPEKKLDLYFSKMSNHRGFRQFGAETWSALLKAASVTILHAEGNGHFDAYLLSESSLFVYPHRIIFKTCGTTTLLLVLPQMMALAKQLETTILTLQYGHYRYNFPEQQIYPHESFRQEREYLSQYFPQITERVLGVLGTHEAENRWYMLCAQGQVHDDVRLPLSLSSDEGDDVLEIVMEGLPSHVRDYFSGSSHSNINERELAKRMTVACGLAEALPGVRIDDWAFEPCGYSMNGLLGKYYYTVHVTPEKGFSFASFETNDPRYFDQKLLDRVISVFSPTMLTLTCTTRSDRLVFPAFGLQQYKNSAMLHCSLGRSVSTFWANFCRNREIAESPEVEEQVANGEADKESPMSKPLKFCAISNEVLVA